jgi:hypothetical protein
MMTPIPVSPPYLSNHQAKRVQFGSVPLAGEGGLEQKDSYIHTYSYHMKRDGLSILLTGTVTVNALRIGTSRAFALVTTALAGRVPKGIELNIT